MSITPEVSAKTLTQLVATEIKVQMARADVRQSQLARNMGKTEQWLSVRLRGRQPIDLNDLNLIAGSLGVGVHDLLPPPEIAAKAVENREVIVSNPARPERPTRPPARPRDNRPTGRPINNPPAGPHRTALVKRSDRRKRD